MSHDLETESATTDLAELKNLFRAPPVLTSESIWLLPGGSSPPRPRGASDHSARFCGHAFW
jgi:hypothetical protein